MQSRLYRCWADMKSRCFRVGNKSYPVYGGRGITVCRAWLKWVPFRNWALANGYQDTLTIDRIKSDGDYKPSNCRWIPKSEQGMNTCRNRAVIRSDGVQFKTIKEAVAKTAGSRQGHIVSCCQGKRHTHLGYKWSYL